jgi:arginine exporter protein ArgO
VHEVIFSGLVTGWAIAIPIGAVGAFLVTLTARTSLRVGAAAALGIATVDGAYAAAAVLGGTALSALLAPVADSLRLVSGVILLAIAALTVVHALSRRSRIPRETEPLRPASAYVLFVGLTAVNPATVVYFTAVVLGNEGLVTSWPDGVAFVAAVFAASASWQLSLAIGGAMLGRVAIGARAQLVTGLTSGLVIGGLAVWTLVS